MSHTDNLCKKNLIRNDSDYELMKNKELNKWLKEREGESGKTRLCLRRDYRCVPIKTRPQAVVSGCLASWGWRGLFTIRSDKD